MAIQRERHVILSGFRGPVLRILRHMELAQEMKDYYLRRTKGGEGARKAGGTQ